MDEPSQSVRTISTSHPRETTTRRREAAGTNGSGDGPIHTVCGPAKEPRRHPMSEVWVSGAVAMMCV